MIELKALDVGLLFSRYELALISGARCMCVCVCMNECVPCYFVAFSSVTREVFRCPPATAAAMISDPCARIILSCCCVTAQFGRALRPGADFRR